MNKKLFSFIVCGFVSAMFFISCATTVNVKLTRPAELDLNGAKTVAVLPIKPYAYYREYDTSLGVELLINSFYQMFEIPDPDEEAAIRALQGGLESGLMESPYINLVSSIEVQRALNKGYINPADVYITGEIAYFNITDICDKVKVITKPAEGDRKAEYEYVPKWSRRVELVFRYQVVDSSSNRVLSYREISCNDSARDYDYKKNLPSAYSLIELEIRSAYKKILKEIQPYTVVKSIKLLQTKTKDKSLKERMKAADSLAQNNLIKEASATFGNIYRETGLVEAGYNEAILQEALGNLSLAEQLMLQVYQANPDSRVMKGLSDIRYEIDQARKLNKQINSSDSASEDLGF